LLLQELINETISETHPLLAGPNLMPKSSLDLKFSYSCQNLWGNDFMQFLKDKNIQDYLLDVEKTGNQLFQITMPLQYDNKFISKLVDIRSNDFLLIVFDLKIHSAKENLNNNIAVFINLKDYR
jgi:hypothetical protein